MVKILKALTRSAVGKAVAAMIALILLLAFLKYRSVMKAISENAFVPPPEAVTTAVAEEVSWTPTLEVVGSLAPTQGITVRSEERGRVTKIAFESGARVNAGDLLVQLDTTVEEAQLKAAVARLELARINHKRALSLKTGNAMSESALDNAVAALKSAEGEVEAIRAVIGRKTISAPFSGRTGIRQLNLGEFIVEGTNIVPLHAYNPIFINFSVPQQKIKYLNVSQSVTITVDTYPGERFVGAISALNPQVEPSTRNVAVQATIDNQDERLKPGMFARVLVALGNGTPSIVVPASAISYAPFGDSVYVVEQIKEKGESDDVKEFLGVRQQFVKLGEAKGDQVIITEGLKAGEQVATSGLFKLRPNAPVLVNNTVVPSNSVDPAPAES